MDAIRDPSKLAERGEQIYNEKFREVYEEEHRGKFVAIDVTSEHAYLGDTPEVALENARKESPKGVFHLIRVGHLGAFRVSRTHNAPSRWIFR
jgi:hypothetical protein